MEADRVKVPDIGRKIPILDPKDPAYLWMDTLIERDFSKLKKFSKRDIDRSWKIHKCYPFLLRMLAKLANIRKRDLSQCWKIHKRRQLFVRMSVAKNRVRGPSGSAKSMLQYLCRCYGLPNLDLIYFQQDGLFDTPVGDVPIFTGARTYGIENTILFTDWYFQMLSPKTDWNDLIDRVDRKLATTPWRSRAEKVFWRGNTTDASGAEGIYTVENWFTHTRAKAYLLSKKHPEFIDAAFTEIWPYDTQPKAPLREILPLAPFASIETHLDYKYQLQMTGIMANFPRDRWQFYSQSVVFRHESPHEMFWYSLIHPWEHYIPIKKDLSDLLEKVQWAKDHDEECKAMAHRARRFIETHVMPEHIALYCYKVLLKYKTLLQD